MIQSIILIAVTVLIGLFLLASDGKNEDLRNLGFSEPLEESQIIKLSIESSYMEREMPCMIYLPKGYSGGKDYPVWYGLHSYGSNESMWINSGVTEAADELIDDGVIEPTIMIFPYTRDATTKEISKDFEDNGIFNERNIDQFICKELIPYIDSHYYTITSADGRYIGGYSMGGMIALRIAFRHTDKFSKVGAYSASVSTNFSDRQLEKWLFPNDNIDEIEDISIFVKQKGLDKLNVYLDAGDSNDPFADGLQSLNDALQERGIKSEFDLHDGDHLLRTDKINDYLEFYAEKE